MQILLIAAMVGLALVLLHVGLTFAERRGWVFYRTRPPRIQFLGTLEELVEPRVEYLIEEQSSEAIRADQAETGEGERQLP